MGKGMGNMGNIMKQAKAVQQKMSAMQDELANKQVEASAGGGMVTVVANGKQEILSIKIEPDVVSSQDVDMLEDLVTAAVNEALRKAQDMASKEVSKITGGMNIPGLF